METSHPWFLPKPHPEMTGEEAYLTGQRERRKGTQPWNIWGREQVTQDNQLQRTLPAKAKAKVGSRER